MSAMSTAGRQTDRDVGLGRLVIDDLRRARLNRGTLRELEELYRFYVDDEARRRLASMGRIKRAFWVLGWLLKSLLLKLSPGRALMLVAAMVLVLFEQLEFAVGVTQIETHPRIWAFLLLLLVLMLELKDKLLARDEIDVARQVQLALLPQRQPNVPGWSVWSYTRPANDVGGDLVDYLEFGADRVGIVLGDVAGKGLGAALLTAKLQATLRAVAPECTSLDELGHRANAILFRDGLDNRFATMFYLELEGHDGRVRYLNAGHNPPCVVGPGRAEQLHASSLPLGMMETASYSEGALDLRPGDVLLAYSDGLTEATNERDEEFGVERVERLLPEIRELAPDQAGPRVLREVDRFLGDLRPGDDLSLVIIRRDS